jgi:hypothetical protein
LGAYGNGTNQKEKPNRKRKKTKTKNRKNQTKKKEGTFITFTIGLRFTAEIVADIFVLKGERMFRFTDTHTVPRTRRRPIRQ